MAKVTYKCPSGTISEGQLWAALRDAGRESASCQPSASEATRVPIQPSADGHPAASHTVYPYSITRPMSHRIKNFRTASCGIAPSKGQRLTKHSENRKRNALIQNMNRAFDDSILIPVVVGSSLGPQGLITALPCRAYIRTIVSSSGIVISDYRHKFLIVGVYTAFH
jgi:hypothetical protein